MLDPQRKRQGARYRTRRCHRGRWCAARRQDRRLSRTHRRAARALSRHHRAAGARGFSRTRASPADTRASKSTCGAHARRRSPRPASKPRLRPRRDGRERLVALRAHLPRSTQRRSTVQLFAVRPGLLPEEVLRRQRLGRPLRLDGRPRARASRASGGCASACKYDSQKPVVLGWEGQLGSIYNPRYLAFAAHYGIRPAAVRGKPNAKPRVEHSFWEHERSFLNGRSFSRPATTFAPSSPVWLDRVVDPRKRATVRVRSIAFKTKPPSAPAAPRTLTTHGPRHLSALQHRRLRRVARAQSATPFPHDHVTDFLALRVTQTELFIYGPDIAYPSRVTSCGPADAARKIDPLGLHPRPNRQAVIDGDKLRAAFADMGDPAPPRSSCQLIPPLPTRIWTPSRPADPALAHRALQHRRRRGRPRPRGALRRPRGWPRSNASSPAGIDRARSTNTSPRTPHNASTTPSDPASPRRAISPEYDALPALAARVAHIPSEPDHGQDQDPTD